MNGVLRRWNARDRGLQARLAWYELSTWPARRWAAAVVATALTATVIGIPTGIIRTPLYMRMTPVLWWNYPVWAATAVLEGVLLASFLPVPHRGPEPLPAVAEVVPGPPRGALGGGVLSFLAVGCPICNKLVVALIGISGALTWFAPLQPFLGGLSLALVAVALAARLAPVSCPLSAGAP